MNLDLEASVTEFKRRKSLGSFLNNKESILVERMRAQQRPGIRRVNSLPHALSDKAINLLQQVARSRENNNNTFVPTSLHSAKPMRVRSKSISSTHCKVVKNDKKQSNEGDDMTESTGVASEGSRVVLALDVIDMCDVEMARPLGFDSRPSSRISHLSPKLITRHNRSTEQPAHIIALRVIKELLINKNLPAKSSRDSPFQLVDGTDNPNNPQLVTLLIREYT